MKRVKKIFTFFFCLLLWAMLPVWPDAKAVGMYTYTYDYWGDERESPAAYAARTFIAGNMFGIGDFSEPQGMFVKNGKIYICDTGNNRIVVFELKGTEVKFVEEFGEISGDVENKKLSGPNDIFVAENGDMYICDTKNQRILHVDKNHKFIKELTRPNDETVDQASDFLPQKAVADSSGRVYAVVKNYNKGFVEYDASGKFSGYIGANQVTFKMSDYFWKLISTKAQREQMEQFVPTEYNNLFIDNDGFIYATTSTFEEYDLLSDKAKPIRKLNSLGTDILIKNGEYPPIGDIDWGKAGGISGPSKLIDITVLDREVYYALDMTRGRIFGYDSQGNLLYAFGGLGNKLGYFQYPTAIEHDGDNLLVLDSKNAGITIFETTNYGKLINNALDEYKKGNYDSSSDYWRQVLALNGNYDQAYIGIGRSLLRQGEYKQAMHYFKVKNDEKNYAKAFKLYRKEWMEKNIGWIFGIIIAAIVISSSVKIARRIIWEARRA